MADYALTVANGLKATENSGAQQYVVEVDPDNSSLEIVAGKVAIKDKGVGLAKLLDIATDKILGRATAENGSVELLACTAAGRALLAAVDAAAQRALIVPANSVTKAMLEALAADTILGRATGIGNVEALACTAAGRALLAATSAAAQRALLERDWNLLINGGFDVWQRSTSVSGAGVNFTGTYQAADRFYALGGLVASSSPVTSNAHLYERSTADATSRYCAKVRYRTGTGTRNAHGLCQIFEGADIIGLRGRTITAQARVQAELNKSMNVRIAIVQWTGTVDSVTHNIVNDWTSSNYTPGNFFIAANVAVTVSDPVAVTNAAWADVSVSAVVSASTNNILIFVWGTETALDDANAILISKVACQAGGTALWCPRHIAQELLLCQRYYERMPVEFYAYGGAGGGNGAFFHWKTTKRTAVAAKIGTWQVLNCAQPVVGNTYNKGCVVYALVTNTGYAGFWPATEDTCYIEADSEL